MILRVVKIEPGNTTTTGDRSGQNPLKVIHLKYDRWGWLANLTPNSQSSPAWQPGPWEEGTSRRLLLLPGLVFPPFANVHSCHFRRAVNNKPLVHPAGLIFLYIWSCLVWSGLAGGLLEALCSLVVRVWAYYDR